MKGYKIIVAILVAVSAIGFALGSGAALLTLQKPQATDPKPKSSVDKEKESMFDKENPFVDLTADVTEQRAAKDSTIYLIGNVAFHHNGAIIQCDSAKRYTSSEKMDFFGNVIICKDSAFIYGEKVSYDAATDMAEVFSPLVKMLRGDVTLYSYNLKFNTKTNIAYFENGGIMNKGANFLESQRGEFNVDKNIIKFVDSVAMKNENYDIKTDSLDYNLDTEVVTFLDKTYIWDRDSSIMNSYKGFYFTKTETYEFLDRAYILTKEQEMWADTMNYYSPMRQATMRRNVQVLDTVNKTIAFGDWAFYDDSLGVAILTQTPSVRSYGGEKNDTTYMRADTLYMTTYMARTPIGTRTDSLKKVMIVLDSMLLDSLGGDSVMFDSIKKVRLERVRIADSIAMAEKLPLRDSLPVADAPLADSTVDDVVERPIVDSTERGIEQPEIVDSTIVDSLGDGQFVAPDMSEKNRALRDSALNDNPSAQGMFDKMMGDKAEVLQKNALRESLSDSVAFYENMIADSSRYDTITKMPFESDTVLVKKMERFIEQRDSLSKTDEIPVVPEPNDTIYRVSQERIMRAYHNVRMWSRDNQSICDSAIAFSMDSVAQMHGKPIVWSENSQITAQQINAYTVNDQLDWVEFIGDPFITQAVEPKYPEPADTARFNQAKGKLMFAYFKNNEIDSVILSGNVINYYYMENDGYTSAFVKIECADQVVFFEERKVSKMRWEGKGDWDVIPLEQVPAEMSQRIEGFSWQQDKRPKNAKEISDRELKPSRRVQMFEIPLPSWAIRNKIEAYKKEIQEKGAWTDRTDENTITVEYFQTRNENL